MRDWFIEHLSKNSADPWPERCLSCFRRRKSLKARRVIWGSPAFDSALAAVRGEGTSRSATMVRCLKRELVVGDVAKVSLAATASTAKETMPVSPPAYDWAQCELPQCRKWRRFKGGFEGIESLETFQCGMSGLPWCTSSAALAQHNGRCCAVPEESWDTAAEVIVAIEWGDEGVQAEDCIVGAKFDVWYVRTFQQNSIEE